MLNYFGSALKQQIIEANCKFPSAAKKARGYPEIRWAEINERDWKVYLCID